jgi:hypothetical protein
MICSICNAETADNLKVCTSCGSPVAQKKGKTVETLFKRGSKAGRSNKAPAQKWGDVAGRSISAQGSNDPHRASLTLSVQPAPEWIAAFYRHWKKALKSIYPKPEARFSNRNIEVICQSDFAERYIAPVMQCIDQVNEEQAQQIKVVSQ